MSTLSLRLPQSVHRQLSALAKREGVSINQLINSAVAEKIAALMTAEYLEERARRSLMLFSRMLPTSSLMTSIG
ncbi:MAG: toxin-antitoxin system HicB family antitoxin [Myxococcota bacterium]